MELRVRLRVGCQHRRERWPRLDSGQLDITATLSADVSRTRNQGLHALAMAGRDRTGKTTDQARWQESPELISILHCHWP